MLRSLTNETTSLQHELSEVRAEFADLRSRSGSAFALVDNDHYWSLCVQERQLLRLLHGEHDQDSDVSPYPAEGRDRRSHEQSRGTFRPDR